jgi:uncharacterized protein YceK
MKRFWLILLSILLLVFAVGGCASIQLADSPQTEKVIITSAARLAGYKIAQNNPELAALALPYAQTIIAMANNPANAQDVVQNIYPAATKALLEQIKDPVIRLTVTDALSLVQINTTAPIEVNLGKINFALAGFTEGLTLANK